MPLGINSKVSNSWAIKAMDNNFKDNTSMASKLRDSSSKATFSRACHIKGIRQGLQCNREIPCHHFHHHQLQATKQPLALAQSAQHTSRLSHRP